MSLFDWNKSKMGSALNKIQPTECDANDRNTEKEPCEEKIPFLVIVGDIFA